MFRALIVAGTPEVAEALATALSGSGRFGPVRSTDSSQSPHKLDQILRINASDVVFFEAGGSLDVVAQGQRLSELHPGLPIVAFGRTASWEFLLHLIRAGICEYLATPIYEREVIELAERLERQGRTRPVNQDSAAQIVSFLPAKPGAGASTIAMNTSAALAKQFQSRTLLVDLDFSAGIISFALDVKPVFSVLDALEHLNDLEHELWAKIVVEKGNLHVLPAPDTPATETADLSRFTEIMHFGRRFYDVVCVDLSGGLEDFTLGVMEESRHIFVVCSLETPVLHLARRRIARLSQLGFRDRVSVIVNRWNARSGITLEQVSEMLGRPVYATACNDYAELQKAFNKGVTVDPTSLLGQDFTSLAARIGGHPVEATAPPRGLVARISQWLFPAKQGIPEPMVQEMPAPAADMAAAVAEPAPEEAAPAPPPRDEGVPERAPERAPEKAPEKASKRRTPSRRASPKSAEPLSADEVGKLIARCEEGSGQSTANGVRLRALISLLWETGLPLTEAVQLTATRLQEECYIGDDGWPAVSSNVVAALEQCTVSASGRIFGEARGNSVETWRRRLNDLGKKAAIPNVAARLAQPRARERAEPGDSLTNLANAVGANSDSVHEGIQVCAPATAHQPSAGLRQPNHG